jgi:hypothetical protein
MEYHAHTQKLICNFEKTWEEMLISAHSLDEKKLVCMRLSHLLQDLYNDCQIENVIKDMLKGLFITAAKHKAFFIIVKFNNIAPVDCFEYFCKCTKAEFQTFYYEIYEMKELNEIINGYNTTSRLSNLISELFRNNSERLIELYKVSSSFIRWCIANELSWLFACHSPPRISPNTVGIIMEHQSLREIFDKKCVSSMDSNDIILHNKKVIEWYQLINILTADVEDE